MYRTEKVIFKYLKPNTPFAGVGIRDNIPDFTWTPVEVNIGSNIKGGNSLPGYRRIIAQKGNATTMRSVTYHNVHIEPAYHFGMLAGPAASPASHPQAVACYGSSVTISTTNPSLPAGPLTSESASVDSYCAQKFRAKCEERLVLFQGPTFLGELRETIQFLTRPFPALLKASKRFYYKMLRILKKIPARRRNRKGNAKRIAETMQDGWLSWKLAVSPLIGDIESACETIANYDKTVSLDVSSAHRGTYAVASGTDNPLGGTMYWNRDTVYRCSMIGQLSARIVPPPGTVDRVMQMIQMDYRGLIENFIPTVYQLIPMSFLLDYVSNAGAVLENACVAHPQLAWLSTTRKTTRRRYAWYYPNVAVPPKYEWFSKPDGFEIRNVGVFSHSLVTIDRTYVRPEIRFQFELPNVFQALTITALLKLASRVLKA